jgi:hypothetical protein
VAKFYPKAPSNNLNQSESENIYENIDENLNKCQSSQQHTTLNSPMNASSKRSKFQGLKQPMAFSLSSSSRNTNTDCSSASRKLKNSNNEISRGPITHDLSYQSVPIRKKRSASPTNSSKLSITLSTSSGSSSSQKIENKNLIKNNNYNSLSRFKMNNEQFL